NCGQLTHEAQADSTVISPADFHFHPRRFVGQALYLTNHARTQRQARQLDQLDVHTTVGKIAGLPTQLTEAFVPDTDLPIERSARMPPPIVGQYQRGSPCGRCLKRFMLHMYWSG